MTWDAQVIFSQTHSGRRVRVIDEACNRMVHPDLLALDANKLREAPPFTRDDKIISGGLAFRIALGLDHEVLDLAMHFDAVGQSFDILLCVRHPARVFVALLELVQGNVLAV
jgi:hypothetical protein